MMRRQPGHPVSIVGTGGYLPGPPVAFEDLDRWLGPLDGATPEIQKAYQRGKQTMRTLLGMDCYHFAFDPETRSFTETPSTLAAKAAERALASAGMTAADVDLLLYAGSSQDRFICPPTSVFVQQHLGIARCAEMSIHANCTSTYKAIQVAADQIAMGRYRTVLVTTANMVSGHALAATLSQPALTRHQALMRVFLCDGGGALVLTRDPPEPRVDSEEGRPSPAGPLPTPGRPALEVWDTFIESPGGAEEPQMYSRYGSASVAPEAIARGDHHVTQNMTAVGAMAVEVFLAGFQRFADQLGINPGDPEVIEQVAYFLANVPSDHLVEATHEEFARRYGVPVEVARKQYYSTVAGRGYTGPAALPITLDVLFRERKVPNGKFLVSFVTESSKWMNAGLLLRSRA